LERGLGTLVTKANSRGKHWLEIQIEDGLLKGEIPPKPRNYFYAGWAGQCPRFVQAAMKAELPFSTMKWRQRKAFEYGNSAHSRYQNAIKLIITDAQIEMPVRFTDDGVTISGKIDVVTQSPLKLVTPVEIKTINAAEFSKLIEPKYEHRCQWTIYAHHLKCENGLIMYENKEDPKNFNAILPELKIFEVIYSDTLYKDIIKTFKYIIECNTIGKLADAPEKCPNPFCEIKCKRKEKKEEK